MPLCDFCSTALTKLNTSNSPNVEQTGIYVMPTRRSLKEVMQLKDQCDLCDMVASRLSTQGVELNDQYEIGTTKFCYSEIDGPDPYDLEPDWISNRIDIKAFPAAANARSAVTGFSGPLLPCEEDEAAKARPHSILQLQRSCEYMPSTSSSDIEGVSPEPKASGRILHTKADLSLFAQWIHLCRTRHGDRCSRSIWPCNSDQELKSLLVIDVKQMCIIEAPKDCRYVALSYCLGNVPTIQHLSSNSAKLRTKGVLEDLNLALTIRDAIGVVHGVGERYLWVDALCIIQDDVGVQQVQLAQMGLIYSLAAFTIIAAAGPDANSGLPGVRDESRVLDQKILHTTDKTYLSVIDGPYYGGVRGSTWIRRAWTMQEKILSKRNLIFTEKQVYWTCWSAVWLEEVILEQDSNITFLDIPTNVGPADLGFSSLEDEHSLDHFYQLLVNAYMQRQLSFEADILNAFSGICQALSAIGHNSFFWGLPEAGFSRALAWGLRPGGESNHASCNVNGVNATTEKVLFPSWSWAAWFGEQNRAWISWFGAYEEEPDVLFYRYNEHEQLIKIDGRTSSEWYQNRAWDRNQGPGKVLGLSEQWRDEPRTVIDEMVVTVNHPNHCGHVIFWTSVARLAILRPSQREFSVGSAGQSPYKILPEIDSHVRLESTAHIPFQSSKELKEVPAEIMTEDRKYGTSDIFMRDFIIIGRKESELESLMALVVEWRDGVAYRIGTATVAERDWVSLERSWRLITLG